MTVADQPDPTQPASSAAGQLPTEALRQAVRELLKVAGQRAVGSLTSRLGAAGKAVGGKVTDRAKEAVEQAVPGGAGGGLAKVAGAGIKGGAKAAVGKVKEALGGGGGGGGQGKSTNIVEQIDVGVPVRVAYDQWTRFTDFPGFMKKVENVEQVSDTEVKWRGQILWSHRDWKATIVDQVPDQRIVWRSEGAKGYVDGAVTFHELAPNLTRILLVLEYYPQGLFEKTGNLWRAQGRRARLELKHFRRHVMTQTALHREELEGWRGEIRDGEVTQPAQSEDTEQPEKETEPEKDTEQPEKETEGARSST